MKTQRRHELQTNQLADWLGRQIENLKPYNKTILAILIAVAAVVGAYFYLTRAQRVQAEEAWNEYYLAVTSGDSERLREVAERYNRTTPGLWARLSAADVEQANGIRRLFSDRELGEQALDRAKNEYSAVMKAAANDTLLKQRAQFGLAQAHESLGELEVARKHYEQLAGQDAAIGRAAESRLANLQQRSTQQLYEALAAYEPPRRDTLQSPGGLLDPNLPLNLEDLPDLPDLNVPQQPSEGGARPAGAIQPAQPTQAEISPPDAEAAQPQDAAQPEQPPTTPEESTEQPPQDDGPDGSPVEESSSQREASSPSESEASAEPEIQLEPPQR